MIGCWISRTCNQKAASTKINSSGTCRTWWLLQKQKHSQLASAPSLSSLQILSQTAWHLYHSRWGLIPGHPQIAKTVAGLPQMNVLSSQHLSNSPKLMSWSRLLTILHLLHCLLLFLTNPNSESAVTKTSWPSKSPKLSCKTMSWLRSMQFLLCDIANHLIV